MTAIHPHSPVENLQRRILGAVIEPGTPGWDEATQAFNTHFIQTPALVTIPANVQDVVAIVEFARAHGLQVAAQRTGHNAEPFGSEMDDLLLVKTDLLQGVEIDVTTRRARVASGTKWAQVVPRASELGLAALHGSTPDVSVTGYSLGGGVGWYARKLGLATNSVLAIELVTADGRLRRVDHEHDAELFWALRGGGGNFGVVTAIEFQLYAIPEIYAGVLFFPWERSSEVLHAWNEWRQTVPDEVTSVGRILQFPPLPELPEELRGQQFAVVEAAYIGDEASGAELLAPLRALGPAMDTFAMVPPVGLAELHMDPPDPLPYTGEGMMLSELPAKAIDAFVAAAGPESGSPLDLGRDQASGRGALPRQRPARRPRHVRRRVPHVRHRPRPRRRDVEGEPRPAAAAAQGADAVRLGPPVPQLHRGEDGRLDLLPAEGVQAAAGGEGRGRPRRPLPRQPPDPRP